MGCVKSGLAGVVVLAIALSASAATIVAQDDAADPVYNPGVYHGQNGGFGLTPFVTNGFPFGGDLDLQMHVGMSSLNGPPGPDIDTGGRAWGNNVAPNFNKTFFARRSLTFDLGIGGTYSINLDTGSVDGRETVSFGLGANVMCRFYLDDSFANYQFEDVLSGSVAQDTGILQTFGGLRLTVTRNTALTYSFLATPLAGGTPYSFGPAAYDASIITGIRTIIASNNDGGNGPGHAMFINSIEATAVPEPASGFSLVSLLCAATMTRRHKRA